MDASGQMRGWFKLIETIRKTDPPSNEILKTSPNSTIINTNGHLPKSPETIHMDSFLPESPDLISSPPQITLASTPIQSFDDTPEIHPEPTPKSTASKRSSTRHKKITIRKSTRSKEFSSITNTSDDSIIHQRTRQSADTSLNISIIPLATDLQSLPGHIQNELRDQRFVDYSDIDTLSMHLNTCLYIDKKSFSLSSLTRQHIFKTRHNILNKIFKLDHMKASQKTSSKKNEETLNGNNSSSSMSFKTDWSVNRRSSSSHRHEPKNIFHILQLNPTKQIFLTTNKDFRKNLTIEEQQNIHYEQMKSLLIRTYYPHFHTAIQRGQYFGSKSNILVKHHDVPIIINPQSPTDIDETMTIKLNSPLPIPQQESRRRGRKRKHKKEKEKDKPLPLAFTQRRVSEEIPPVVILKSPPLPPPPSIEKEVDDNMNNRKRKTSMTMNLNISETKKKKKIIQPLSPEILINDYQDVSYSDSDDDILPDELPKQTYIKNGLRSNYYKTTSDIDIKSNSNKNRLLRQRRQSLGALPSFYTGIFHSEDDKLSIINYQLPYDIYWFSQKQGNTILSPSKPINQNKKKKSSESKQKQPVPIKRIINNNYIDPSVQSNILSSNKKHINKDLIKMEELTTEEKQIILQTSIFLKRNLQRIKDQKDLKDKNNNQQKQQIDEQLPSLFFPQNYYHSNTINKTDDLNENLNISHKDLLNLFYNYIRRSHFGKTRQCSVELIDKTCYYAQLAQLTLILNEIFDLLLNYKCPNSDIYPTNALKKCPLKRLFPMYYEIISKPIDLTIIRNKLDNGDYFSYNSFEQDLLLLFTNAITYCGEDSDVGRAVKDLQIYFLDILKIEYQSTIDLFNNMNEENKNERNLNILKDFITRLHEKEVLNGQCREILYDAIFTIDNSLSITIPTNTHQTPKNTLINKFIIHCRCGSFYDETALVQCYACHLWQHISCVTITDTSRPYFCFECHPLCEQNPSDCLKTNVCILENSQSSYLAITRSDGFIIRINECYFVSKQEENPTSSSSQYDIFFIERLWMDENNIGKASGFYYLRPYETFHEVTRKFYSNEVFRFPSTNDSIEIKTIIRPCYVLDTSTFCKGKPICEYSSRILSTDLFICEYRVDKLARTFTRLPKTKHIGINTKSYCFDNYIEKLSIKRDYQ
ncbi:unnamed protein product, partial [Adineta steineri]